MPISKIEREARVAFRADLEEDYEQARQQFLEIFGKSEKFATSRQRRWFFATLGRPGGVQRVGGIAAIPTALNRPDLKKPKTGPEARKKLALLGGRAAREYEELDDQRFRELNRRDELKMKANDALDEFESANDRYWGRKDTASEEERESLLADMQTAQEKTNRANKLLGESEQELVRLNERIGSLRERYREKEFALVTAENPYRPEKITIDLGFSTDQKPKIQRGVDSAFDLIDNNVVSEIERRKGHYAYRYDIVPTKESRSYYNPNTHITHIRTSAGETTVVHETGHWLETSVPEINRKGIDFRDKRAAGENPTPFGPPYDANEIGVRDKFSEPYMGKIYPNNYNSEIISMGMQLLFEKPAEFAIEDPEYFDFMFETLRGR